MAAIRSIGIIGVVFVLAATACGGSSEAPVGNASAEEPSSAEASPIGTFALGRSDCGYDGPTVVGAGDATFTLTSRGGTADFDLWLLEDGRTYEELAAHIDEERRRSEQGRPPLGHPSFATLVAEASTDSGGQGTLAAALQPGVYGTACIRFGERLSGLWPAGPFTVEA